MNLNFTTIRLNHNIRLRKEYFGGLIYDRDTGNTLEVDKSTYQFLELIKDKSLKVSDAINLLRQNNIIKKYDKSIDRTIQKLLELQIIETANAPPSLPVFTSEDLSKINHKPWLSAPETVHWAVTYRCNENCPDCYIRRFSFIKKELNSADALKLIDKIAKWNVFQLAIGGGEPFLRGDLLQIVRHASTQGLSVHITTGKLQIGYGLLESISPFIKNLQLGIRPWDLMGPQSKNSIKQTQELFNTAKGLDITLGANIFLSRSTIEQLENLIKILIDIGINRIIFLRYKPSGSFKRWKEECPDSEQLNELHKKINNIITKISILNIRVDCALSFVQRYLPKGLAERYGIKGCAAGNRILAIAPDGSVYPCSQLVHPNYNAGNLLECDIKALWDKSQILRKYRSFRTKKEFTNSWCGVCRTRDSCGGCRLFARDRLGGDSGCPEPLLHPLTKIGKVGRSLDLVEYMKNNYIISVGQYMERYRVGHIKAIKELNNSTHVISTTGKPARKKKDTYKYVERDIVSDIQDSIGATSGGAPFVPYEQIKKWIEEASYSEDYLK